MEKLQPSSEGDGFSGFTWSIGLWHCQDASVRVLRAGAGVLVLAPSDASQGADVRYLDLTWGQCFNCFVELFNNLFCLRRIWRGYEKAGPSDVVAQDSPHNKAWPLFVWKCHAHVAQAVVEV